MILAALVLAQGYMKIPDQFLTNGFALGCQAWTFNRFTTFEAIEKTAASGAKVIELFPGQKLRPDSNVRVGPEMPADELQKLRDQLAKFHLQPVAYGVTGIPREEPQARKLFTWAKGLGIGIINTESVDALDTIEKMVREFDMRVGFHDHPRTNDPNYRMWDPRYIRDLVKDRDRRIGACADTGHWARSGIDPVSALKVLFGRVVSVHLKDLNQMGPGGHDVPFGTGVCDIKSILLQLRVQKFDGSVSIEYEYHEDNNLPEVIQCVDFVRNWRSR